MDAKDKANEELRQRAKNQVKIQQEYDSTVDQLEPDNEISCKYYDTILKNGIYTPHQASIGTLEFDTRESQYFSDMLRFTLDGRQGRRESVLELMSGDGRNRKTLKRMFNRIEMLEQCPRMVELYQADIFKHIMKIQDFPWPTKKYNCIVGCWVLGYLNKEDRGRTMLGIHQALRKDGYLVLFEAVT